MNAKRENSVNTLEAWGRLWGEGAADSFGAKVGASPSSSPLAKLWQTEFSHLPPNARVLDIATGAGILPRLLQSTCSDESVCCDAVDAAALPMAQRQSGRTAGLPQLRFHERVFAENLPFPDASFDLVTSQFGIEYADLDRALPEACRVIKPGGRLCLVMHHAQGRPATLAREELQHAVWLQHSSGWPEAARQMLLPLSLLRTPAAQARLQADPELQAMRQRYDQAVILVQQRAAASTAPDLLFDVLSWVASVFQVAAQQGQAQGESAWNRMMALVSDGSVRVRDLLDHALDEGRAAGLRQQLLSEGYAVELGRAEELGHCMGWYLRATLPMAGA